MSETTEARKPSRPAANGTQGRGKTAQKPQELFFNRELSWLDFNARVLDEAQNDANPLLERLKFLAIFSNNLDEFFMIYVPGMRGRTDEETDRLLTEAQVLVRLRQIQAKLQPMLAAQYQCFRDLMQQLEAHNVRLLAYDSLTDAQRELLTAYFENEVFPVLTPLAVDPGHPFPYISNLSLSLAVIVYDPRDGQEHFARVKVPLRPVLPRLVAVPGAPWQFVLLEDLIIAHIGRLFAGMEVRAAYPFRVTRNADLELTGDDGGDLMEMIEEQLAQRRFGEVERLEVTRAMPPSMLHTLIHELETASNEEVYIMDGPLNMADMFTLGRSEYPRTPRRAFHAVYSACPAECRYVHGDTAG